MTDRSRVRSGQVSRHTSIHCHIHFLTLRKRKKSWCACPCHRAVCCKYEFLLLSSYVSRPFQPRNNHQYKSEHVAIRTRLTYVPSIIPIHAHFYLSTSHISFFPSPVIGYIQPSTVLKCTVQHSAVVCTVRTIRAIWIVYIIRKYRLDSCTPHEDNLDPQFLQK